ncbi:hypothetical protein BDR26DRAFT_1014151 [Obelidium mucronatum]|nr:hypothetical protein BDR26DRAFT_1014151 [Obelidium mucronatum]
MPPRKRKAADSDDDDFGSESSFNSGANSADVALADDDEVEVSDADSEVSIINCRCGNFEHPDGELMLCCDDCDEWSHVKCVTEVDRDALPDEWRCPPCVLRRQKSDERKRIAEEKAEAAKRRKIEEARKIDRRNANLSVFPTDLALNITFLDLSSNPLLNALPAAMSSLKDLKTAFFSDCGFRTFPRELAGCPSLEMIAFRGNKMTSIPEDALPTSTLRWLILTNNEITALPKSIGSCTRLQKCGLAGNRLTALPIEMAQCKKLALLRISANQFPEFPAWLFDLPELAFVGFAGNPAAPTPTHNLPLLQEIPFHDLTIQKNLGEGASGFISQAFWAKKSAEDGSILETKNIALKVFKGAVTSDGLPSDEMAACIAAGSHPHLNTAIGFLSHHPQNASGLILPLIPATYKNLANPPSFETCTRDVYAPNVTFPLKKVLAILKGVASAAAHLHSLGISHGDLYAHNILVDKSSGFPIFGDFGAAFIYGRDETRSQQWTEGWEKIEVLAFGHLVEDLVGLVVQETSTEKREEDAAASNAAIEDSSSAIVAKLNELHRKCTLVSVKERPLFQDISRILYGLNV